MLSLFCSNVRPWSCCLNCPSAYLRLIELQASDKPKNSAVAKITSDFEKKIHIVHILVLKTRKLPSSFHQELPHTIATC